MPTFRSAMAAERPAIPDPMMMTRNASPPLARLRFAANVLSHPLHQYAQVVVLVLEQPLVGGAELLGRDGVRDQPGEAEAVGRELPQQPLLRLVDVPRAGQPRVGR